MAQSKHISVSQLFGDIVDRANVEIDTVTLIPRTQRHHHFVDPPRVTVAAQKLFKGSQQCHLIGIGTHNGKRFSFGQGTLVSEYTVKP